MSRACRLTCVFLSIIILFSAAFGSTSGVCATDDFENRISAFPESYKGYLRELHANYPNWKFYADNINMTLDEAVELELVKKVTDYKSLSWRSMDLGSYDWGTGEWVSMEKGRWYYVSREVIKYYMDPRNFLNTSYIYTFLQQDYNSNLQNREGLRKIISGSFLERGYDGVKDAYINDIMAAAQSSGVNPYILASTIIQEQGVNGESELISGTYSGYEGYYNFFNVGANGNNPAANGLARAKLENWNSRSAAIKGGAEFCGNKYLKAGQNTYFYMNYNIKDTSNIWHQYATAVHDSASKGYNVSKTYADLKTAELDFLIPVYKDMPETVSELPAKTESLNNYYFNSVSAAGLTPSFNRFTYRYDLAVTGDSTVRVSVPSGATYVGAASYQLYAGNNTVRLTVKAQTGYTRDYVIDVFADKACTLYIDSGGNPSKVMCGDTNGDGNVNGRDLANVQMHILNVKLLSGNNFIGGDTNQDGKINGRDLANVQIHILGIKLLT